MTTPKQAARRHRVEEAAYDLLTTVGYHSASMLAIAQRAGVSNETLYRWYGSKQELFRSLVVANTQEAQVLLETALREGADPVRTLGVLGPALLRLVTGERAITLNRAAAGDVYDSATLGPEIARFGRDTMAPLLHDLMQRALEQSLIACDHPSEATETYLNLLIGDLQVRRVIGVLPALSDDEIGLRSARALDCFLRLYSANPRDVR